MNKILTTTKLTLAVITLTCASASIAEALDKSVAEPYVDSITQWGAWELDIEPAAGGLKKAETRALYTRDSKVTVRTNSFSALSPARTAGAQPPTPPTTPPFGGPSDGFF